MAYYRCDGGVTSAAGGLQCSTGWLEVTEPSFTLVTREQATDFIVAIVMLFFLWKVFSLILHTLGVRS